MQDKTSLGISDLLRQFIEALVDEVVLEGKPFDDQKKKWLQRYSQEEGLDYTELEKNLTEFFETFEELKSNKSKSIERLAKMLAKDCYLEEGKVGELLAAMNEAREKEAERIADEKKAEEERLAREKAEREAAEEAKRKAEEEAEYQKKMKKAEDLFQKWANYYPPGTLWTYERAEKKLHLLVESAALGYAKAQNFLSMAYRNGLGVKRDFKEAFKLSMASALQDNPGGQCDVGRAYLFGEGIEPDDFLAYSWLSKSVQNGNPMGMAYLAVCYLHGIGTVKNKEYAEKLVTQAEEKYRLRSSDPYIVSLPSRIVDCWKNYENIEKARRESRNY